MDKGEFIKGGYTVEPGDGGSWIVRSHVENFLIPAHRGFTNWNDLIEWLVIEHRTLGHPPTKFDPEKYPETAGGIALEVGQVVVPSYVFENLPPELRKYATVEAPK